MNTIFFSYSHSDRRWLDELETLLKPALQSLAIDAWSDKEITPGDLWRGKIREAIKEAKVAVLLVSPKFLDSDFIKKDELPPLLQAAEKRGVTILWIHVRPSLYEYTAIADFQSPHDVKTALSELTRPKRDRVLRDVAKSILEAVQYVRLRSVSTFPEQDPTILPQPIIAKEIIS